MGASVLLVRKREGSVGGGRHDCLGWVVMMEGEEEGSEETTTRPLDLLYAGTTNETKQRSKREQTKSPDRSVIL